MPVTADQNILFGVFKSHCCGSEIVIRSGAVFLTVVSFIVRLTDGYTDSLTAILYEKKIRQSHDLPKMQFKRAMLVPPSVLRLALTRAFRSHPLPEMLQPLLHLLLWQCRTFDSTSMAVKIK